MIITILCLMSFAFGAWLFYPAGKTQGRVEEYEQWFSIFEKFGVNEWEGFEDRKKDLSAIGEKGIRQAVYNRGSNVAPPKSEARYSDSFEEVLRCAFCSRFDECMGSLDSMYPLPITCIINNYNFFDLKKRGEHAGS